MPEASSPPPSPAPPSSAPIPPMPPGPVPVSAQVPANSATVPANTAPVSFGWERMVAADLGVVRSQLQRELREQRFTLMGDTVTTIEATRGSQLAAFVLQHDNLPMTAHIRLNPVKNGCVVSLQLQETGKVPSRFLGVRHAYQRAFADMQVNLDEALVHVDPNLHIESVEAVPGTPEGIGDQLGTAAGHFGRAVVQRANHLLEGKDTSKPTAWKDLDEVLFVSSKGQAELEVDRVQAMLVVAGLVSSQPGAMPANLAHDVEVWAARVESALDLSQGADSVRIELSDEELPVLGFLATQAAIRESVPLRTLHVCTTCRLERITNPDYLRMAERHRKLLALTGGLGTTIGKKGVTPFVIVGQFLKIKKLDPDFVCSRCQSTTADEWVVTFCPKCGDRRQEAVLRTCSKCNYDFRKTVGAPELWHPAPVPALPAPASPQVALPVSAPSSPPASLPPAGWYVDPYKRYAQRWWDGLVWSQYVNGDGGRALDPV
jgi:hypothetical protein